MPSLHLEEQVIGRAPVMILSGRLDIDTAADLRGVLRRRLRAGDRSLVLNLSGLDFMDTSGLATLIEAQMELHRRGGGLVLFGMTPQIDEVFASARVKAMFKVAESEREAIESLP